MQTESTSAAKSLIQSSTPFSFVEFRAKLVELTKEQLRFKDDDVHDKRRLKNASLKLKLTYRYRCAALERSKAKVK